MANRKAIELWAYVLAILALVVAVDGPSISGWWLYDDPQIVLQAARNTPSEVLFTPVDWRTLSAANFTPLVTVSFDVDLSAFGFDPRGFHLHQILSFAVAALLLFVLLRRYVPPWLAGLAAAMVIVSAPGVRAASLLMLRHYVEGLALSLAALVAWDLAATTESVDARRMKTWGLTAAATVAWLAAVLCKEVYATVPLLMLGISYARNESWKRAIARLVPCGVAAVVYLYWRFEMLGTIGGYGSPSAGAFIARLGEVGADVFGSRSVAVLVGAIAIALIVIAAVVEQPSRAGAVLVAFVVVAALPLAGVVGRTQMRYALVPAVLIFAGAALAVARGRRKSVGVALIVIAAASTAVGGVMEHRADAASEWTMRTEGRYVWNRPQDAPILLAGSPEWYVGGLAEMRRLAGRGESPRYVLSETALVLGNARAADVVFADAGSHTVHGIGQAIEARLEAERSRFDPAMPLSLEISRRADDVRWSFGPECRCRWTYFSYPRYGATEVGPSGWLRLPEPQGTSMFRIRRDDAGGRWTISPPLRFPTDGETVRWSRSAK